jgi:hypothetical protein
MNRVLVMLFVTTLLAASSAAQTIKVNPDGVNVNASGATTVFLTFGPLKNHRPAEGTWCGELIPAAPDLGFRCDPRTIFGALPLRFDLSRPSGNLGFTDIMSIPPSVARRAYQAAQDGAVSSFFYVRHFVNTVGGPDEYVPVTCRLSGGGARTPFALTDVKISFTNVASETPIFFIKPGERVPEIKAEIAYNGTGRLKGRWEVVLPGEEPPEPQDLLTEASLPVELRVLQRRYTQVSRFNLFLPPAGKYLLAGPDVSRLPNTAEGPYLVLLRIEATDDKEADTDLAAVGAGPGIVHSGAVAGFPLPVLRYFVGSGTAAVSKLVLLLPAENTVALPGQKIDFIWTETEGAALYQLEVMDDLSSPVLQALLPPGIRTYRAPSWLREKVARGSLQWRVVVLDQTGAKMGETPWRRLRLAN